MGPSGSGGGGQGHGGDHQEDRLGGDKYVRQACEVMIRGTNMRLRTWHLGPFPGIHTSNRIAISVKKVDPETSGLLYSNLPG